MKKWLFNLKQKFARWLLNEQILKLEITQKQYDYLLKKHQKLDIEQSKFVDNLKNTVGNIDVAVDIHMKSSSWAIICIQGKKSDFIKFVDFGQREIIEISNYLRRFEKQNVRLDVPYFIPKDVFFKI